MLKLQDIIAAADQLTPAELERLHEHIQQRRHQGWIVPAENIARLQAVLRPVQDETDATIEAEIDVAINQAIAEVRHERQQTTIKSVAAGMKTMG